MSMRKNPFQKPPLPVEAQLSLLESRGLIIQNRAMAAHHLNFISYYRFCGYAIEFEDALIEGEKCYLPGTTFDHILDCYVFDRKLRLLVIDAIERIEVAIRTTMVNTLALKYGAHWYLDSRLFIKSYKHDELIRRIKKGTCHGALMGSEQHKKRERFLHHYYDKYTDPELPPIWMVAEVLPLGAWSMMFSHLSSRDDQKKICDHYKISYLTMNSWLHSLTYLRNLCAHHTKLWSRNFTLKPQVAKIYESQLKNNYSFSALAAILKIFLNTISPGTNWGQHLKDLIAEHPEIEISKMGFSTNWHKDPLWNITN